MESLREVMWWGEDNSDPVFDEVMDNRPQRGGKEVEGQDILKH